MVTAIVLIQGERDKLPETALETARAARLQGLSLTSIASFQKGVLKCVR